MLLRLAGNSPRVWLGLVGTVVLTVAGCNTVTTTTTAGAPRTAPVTELNTVVRGLAGNHAGVYVTVFLLDRRGNAVRGEGTLQLRILSHTPAGKASMIQELQRWEYEGAQLARHESRNRSGWPMYEFAILWSPNVLKAMPCHLAVTYRTADGRAVVGKPVMINRRM